MRGGLLLAGIGAIVGFFMVWSESDSLGGALVGAAIGALVFGGSALTSDAATWRRYRGRVGVVLLVLPALGVAAYALIAFMQEEQAGPFLWRDDWVELRPVTQMMGAELGRGILEAGGSFQHQRPGIGAPPDRHLYFDAARRVRVATFRERISGIAYECAPSDRTSLNRIACGAPSARIREVFGEPRRRLCAHVAADAPDKAAAALAPSVRAYDIEGTGTRYVAIQDRVAGFIVRAPHDLASDVGELWREC